MHVFQALIEVVAECQTLPHIKTPPNVNGEWNCGVLMTDFLGGSVGIFQAHRSLNIALSHKRWTKEMLFATEYKLMIHMAKVWFRFHLLKQEKCLYIFLKSNLSRSDIPALNRNPLVHKALTLQHPGILHPRRRFFGKVMFFKPPQRGKPFRNVSFHPQYSHSIFIETSWYP